MISVKIFELGYLYADQSPQKISDARRLGTCEDPSLRQKAFCGGPNTGKPAKVDFGDTASDASKKPPSPFKVKEELI
jgi:hypothetical protein